MPRVATVGELLSALDPEQRAAALLPDGPAQIIAPAGSGKTTTLIARLGVLLDRGEPPERVLVLTFNREAAHELQARIASRLAPAAPAAERIEVRTLHALGRQILLDAGWSGELVADRRRLLRAARRAISAHSPEHGPLPTLDELETELSAAKLEGRPPEAASRAVIGAYEGALAARGAVDFDDLIARPVRLLEERPTLRAAWQGRFRQVLVDEFQDVDASQLRLIALLADPERNLFAVGDDDQTIYAWRHADVRRILEFQASYPGARRITLVTNYRCPPNVVTASRRLIETNLERFAKPIVAASGRPARRADVSVFATARPDWRRRLGEMARQETLRGSSVCFLARTRSELTPVALALIRLGVPHAMAEQPALEDEAVVELVDAIRRGTDATPYRALLAARDERGWRRSDDDERLSPESHDAVDALLGWAAGHRSAESFVSSFDAARRRLASLRRPDAAVHLMTVHAAKGREFGVVVVLGFEDDRFPNRRAVIGAAEPDRALEDERRLAYVAVTRATERLVLAYHPERASRFVGEMGRTARARPPVPRR